MCSPVCLEALYGRASRRGFVKKSIMAAAAVACGARAGSLHGMGVSNQLRPALVFQNKHLSVFVRGFSPICTKVPSVTLIHYVVIMDIRTRAILLSIWVLGNRHLGVEAKTIEWTAVRIRRCKS
jgi:hypothetical protein